MNVSTKRILSTIAIIIASVAFGVIVSADLGVMQKSHAQTPAAPIQTSSGAVSSVTIPSFADVASRVMPAVVSITSTEVVKTSDLRRNNGGMGIDPFDFFFGPQGRRSPQGQGQGRQRGLTPDEQDDERKQVAGGSGFIISPDGYILTNNHVVENATKVQVHFGADDNGQGGRTLDAKIVGRDAATDIALVKIDAGQQLPFIALGDSDRIRKGDWAIAVGNPFQFENTLTVGVISARGRSLGLSEATRSFENFIQTDAAINFGNSGGPLININGEVVGINTAIRGGGAQGLGFATPINTAKRLLPQLKEGKVVRGYLGMNIKEVDEQVKEAFNLPEARGALVESVTAGKPADSAGVKPGDVVVEVDGRPVRSNRDLIDYISYQPVGSSVKLAVIRDGQRHSLTAKTAERPLDGEQADFQKQNSEVGPARNKLGMSVQELTPLLRQNYGIDDTQKGVVVTSVKEVSPAGDALNEGDVITEAQGQKVTSVEQFRSIIESVPRGKTIRLYVVTPGRGGQSTSGYRFIKVP
jgi:serine protease Do